MNLPLFIAEWRSNAHAYVRQAKRDGTLSMSVDCLFQCVRIPQNNGPIGTNAGYVVRQIWREQVIPGSPLLSKFVSL